MAENRGKSFESRIREASESVEDVELIRLYDPVGGLAGIDNICDFIIYKYPYEYLVECKSCHGNTLSIFSNDPKKKYGAISNKQWEGLLEASPKKGVVAGVMMWFIDHDITVFIPIKELARLRNKGDKSVNIRTMNFKEYIIIEGRKKRVFFDYDLREFFEVAGENYGMSV